MSSGTIEYDYTQTEKKVILDMIQADDTIHELTEDMFVFGAPVELTPTEVETFNASILVAASSTAPFQGSQTHRYHRVPISGFVYEGITDLEFIIQDFSSVAELLTELNSRLGIYLTEDKVIFTYPTEIGNHTLTIADDSLCYYGSIELTFVNTVWDIGEIIPNTLLVGFYF